ncbi:Uncharacterized protein FWK35_00016481 [Aphis craccivora]|uniref:ATP-dependent DNA helicase PIF1-like n=2 Tax=Aphis craccivora TaxID=307492 RepID=A0A6G0YER6_APHCR|nr:Uncharacterized protein FWK35_00016481 [Aphis craccivora]
MVNVIEVKIYKYHESLLYLQSTDVPIHLKRIQFPIRLAFAMTINKSQFQKMSVCDLNLCTPCFSHGQLYVACSQVGKPSSLFFFFVR